jgi:DNA modification methylase
MTINLICGNNLEFNSENKFDLIYADMIYENTDLSWISYFWHFLKDNGIFIVQTDWHTNYLVRAELETLGNFVNHLVWKNEWGNHPKDRFHACFDDIIIFSKGENYKFYPDRIQVPKVTKNKGLNPSGRETKTATAWIDDICLTTTSKERIKKEDGHLIKWQKPLRLFDRIITPFTDAGDSILDPFAGSATLGEWCIKNNRNYVGIELDTEVYKLAKERLDKCI